MNLYWQVLEPNPGERHWQSFDQMVGDAAAANVQVLPTLFASPSWAAGQPFHPPLGSDTAKAAWRAYVKDAVRRYGPNGTYWTSSAFLLDHLGVQPRPIHVWQVWNEESSPSFWYRQPSAKGYADLLKMTTRALRSVDPNAKVILGGLFPRPNRPGAIALGDYLKAFYKVRNIKSFFDGVAVHPYAPNHKDVRKTVVATRHIMATHGDSATGLWITEMGWANGGSPSPYTKTSAGQAWLLRKAYAMLRHNRSDWHLKSVVWFCWRDRAPDPGEANWWGIHAGLFRKGGLPKPAWNAYAAVAGGTP
jgi:hypothetical protein